MKASQRATELIRELELIPHPEGGYYREVYRSATTVFSSEANDSRSSVTDIYFLLTHGQVSRFHLVLHDEIWNFYEGDPLKLYNFDQTACSLFSTILGQKSPVCYKWTIPGNTYQAAEPQGEYSLVGCTVAPGFDFADFSFLDSDPEAKKKLQSNFPKFAFLA